MLCPFSGCFLFLCLYVNVLIMWNEQLWAACLLSCPKSFAAISFKNSLFLNLFCILWPVWCTSPNSYRWMTEKAKHNHDNGRSEDEPENQPSQAGVDGCDQQVLCCHQHWTRPAVQRAPELQRSFTSPSLRSRVRWRHNHSRSSYWGPGRHSGGQGVCVLEIGVMVMVVMAVVWELFREVEGLVMSPLLQCAIHAHPDLKMIVNKRLYKRLHFNH